MPFPSPRVSCFASAFVFALVAGSPASAQVQSPEQVSCLTALSKGAAKVVKARAKDYQGCLKDAANADLGGCPSAEACVAGDAGGKIASSVAKLRSADEKSCTEEPDFGRRHASLVSASALGETLGLMDDLLGPDLDAAVVPKASDSRAASCQGKVVRSATKLWLAMGAAYQACRSEGLASGTTTSAAGFLDCLDAIDADAKGKIASSRGSLDSTIAGTCDGVNLASTFPGACASAPSFGDCVETSARCRACRRGAIGDDADADCDEFDDNLPNGSCTGASGRCNGHSDLCERTFENVAYPTTHNAFGNAEENWLNPNQRYGLARQLSDGVRGMMLDTYYYNGEVVMCHGFCNLGETQGRTPRELLTSGLGKIREYLEVDPGAVLSIIFESYISEAQAEQAFVDAGLAGFLHEQVAGDPWPTLEDMIASGKRLVVFTDDSSASLPWHHYVWDHAWETHYSFENVEDFSCAINRGTATNDLFILNHFLTDLFGGVALANQANKDPLFLDRALQCELEGGQLPNFVTVDFHDIGTLFSTTNTLNGFEGCAVE